MGAGVTLTFNSRPRAVPYMARGMLPVTRHANLAPQIRAQWRQHHVDATELAAFRRVTGLPVGPYLPLLYPHTFGFRLAMAILTHPTFPVPIWGVLQTRNHIVQHRSIGVHERLDFETHAVPGRAVAKGAEFDLCTTVHVAGELVWHSDLTFFTRGRFGEPGPAASNTRSPSAVGPLVAEWDMRDADHWTFGRFTGDYNGIHMWDWYARRFGFRRALYHPPRVIGECMARLPRLEKGDGRLCADVWIKGPVPHGARVRLHAAQTADSAVFALFAEDERASLVGCLRPPDTARADPPHASPASHTSLDPHQSGAVA